ncbi:MAG: diguanylate cyclase [Sedimentisphaerales bacterium]|nr:diguanylate cyclase [Sedimentisphaerales bacterium]
MADKGLGQFQEAPQSNAKNRILLLGDDGRMGQMLRRELGEGQSITEANILDGIVQFGLPAGRTDQGDSQLNQGYELILLNVERLGNKTIQAVRALRQVGLRAKLILYGEAFAEVYAGPALRAGADDFIVWPIPRADLQTCLNGVGKSITDKHNNRITRPEKEIGLIKTAPAERIREESIEPGVLHRYQALAQLVPKGVCTLIEEAQKILTEVLPVAWVRIHSPEVNEKANEQHEQEGQSVPLMGPNGQTGEMIVGPHLPGKNEIDLKETAGFIGTLLCLAQRDETLKQLAMTDELTGAYNRRYLENFLRQMIRQSQHEHTELTLLLFDIDEFKYYNDNYGHAAGDEVLRQAIQLIRRCCREHDVVTRIGGDEFAVLFWDSGHQRQIFNKDNDDNNHQTGQNSSQWMNSAVSSKTHSEMVMFLSNRFRRLMMTNEFPGLGPEARGVLTISGGLAGFPWDGRTVEELLAAADEALLHAKRSGKNRIYLVGQEPETPSTG